MAIRSMNTVMQHLRRAVRAHDVAGMTDGQLLDSFIARKDEAAFQALMRRHGPMVLGVCRRFLHNHHDAEDAFQATFLVLVRKAPSVRPRDMVASWLYGVACYTARKARAVCIKRRSREKQAASFPEPAAVQADHDLWHDLQRVLDQELSRLPDKYRLPILLCDLEGKSLKEAIEQLGWPQGTVAGRLARGRALLARRLTRHGLALSSGALAGLVSENVATACVPVSLASATMTAVTLVAGQGAAAAIPPKVAVLTAGVLKTMTLTKVKTMSAGLLALALTCYGVGMLTDGLAGDAEAPETIRATAREQALQAPTDKESLQARSETKASESGKLETLDTLPEPDAAPSPSGIRWREYTQGRNEASEKNRPILLFAGTSSCVFCERQEKALVHDPKMPTLLKEQLVPIKVDCDKDAFLHHAMRIQRLPTLILARADGRIVHRVEGLQDSYALMQLRVVLLQLVTEKVKAENARAPEKKRVGAERDEARSRLPAAAPVTLPQAEAIVKQAFGDEGGVAPFGIKILLRSMFVATDRFETEKDGRVRLEPFRAVIFGRDNDIETTVVRSDRAVVTFDEPLATLADVGKRNIVAAQFSGKVEMRRVKLAPRAPAK